MCRAVISAAARSSVLVRLGEFLDDLIDTAFHKPSGDDVPAAQSIARRGREHEFIPLAVAVAMRSWSARNRCM